VNLQIKDWYDAVTDRLIEILDQYLVCQQEPSLSTLIERADVPWQNENFIYPQERKRRLTVWYI